MNLIFRLLHTLLFSRFRKPIDFLEVCVTPFRCWLTDLDVLFHMNNGKYFSILDIARTDLMIRAGLFNKLARAGYYPVVIAETMQFRKSIEPGQKFEVHSQVLGWDEKMFFLRQTFKVKGLPVAEAHIVARFLKRGKGPVLTSEILLATEVNQVSPAIPQWVLTWFQDQKKDYEIRQD